jgi:hypothetical protein
MIFQNTLATFNLSCPSGKRETEGFHWIRKESDMAKYITRLDFSYQRGFTVSFCVPEEWSKEQLGEKVDRTCSVFHAKFVAIKEEQ